MERSKGDAPESDAAFFCRGDLDHLPNLMFCLTMTYAACIGTQGSHHPLVYELGVLMLVVSARYDLAPKLRDFFLRGILNREASIPQLNLKPTKDNSSSWRV